MDARPPPRAISYIEAHAQLARLSKPVLRKLCYVATNRVVEEPIKELARMVSVIAETPRSPVVIPVHWMDEGLRGRHRGIFMYVLSNQHIHPKSTRTKILDRYHEKQGEEEAYNVRIISNRVCAQIENYVLGSKEYASSRETLRIRKLMVGKVSFPRTHALHSGMVQRFGQKYHPAGYTHMICLAVFDPAMVEGEDGPGVEKMALRIEADAHEFCRKQCSRLYDSTLSKASTGGMVKSNHEDKLYMVYMAVKARKKRERRGKGGKGTPWVVVAAIGISAVLIVGAALVAFVIKAIG
jgi:hypothetical protein